MLKSSKPHIATGAKILLFIVGLALIYIFAKSILNDTLFFKNILIGYARSVAAVLGLLVGDVRFDALTGDIIRGEHLIHAVNGLAIKFYAVAFAILFFWPKKIKQTILVFIGASVAFYVLVLLRFMNDFFTPTDLSGFFFSVVVGLRYLVVYLVIKYKIGLHSFLTDYFNKIDVKVQSAFHLSFHKLLIIVALVPAITGVFDWFLIAKWNYFVVLSNFILWLSNGILWLAGYREAYVYGNYILLGNYWLYLGTNCLGVGLMVVFTSLIIAIRSPLLNRLVFIIAGLVLLLFLNALRIAGILLYIYTDQTPQHLIEDYHDQSNNLFYFVVFVIMLFYINKFQFVKLGVGKKRKL